MGSGDIARSQRSGGPVAVAGKPRRYQRALLVFRFAGGCSRLEREKGSFVCRDGKHAETTLLSIDLNSSLEPACF